jgi:hypothetical protein
MVEQSKTCNVACHWSAIYVHWQHFAQIKAKLGGWI